MMEAALESRVIDVEYLGRPSYIACCLLEGDRPAIIDPGPTVSLPKLEEGLAAAGMQLTDLAAILLTHIHLDHAGATGTIVRRHPDIAVYVHEIGAPHLVAPERLLRSAERLYGDRMEALWGEFAAVPRSNLKVLSGGETIDCGRRRLDVAYTPGHASHHVSYLDNASGTAFIGDTAGIRIENRPFVLPVTPPPDIDLEIWEESLQRIEAWDPERLFVTHFGPADGVGEHLEDFRRGLHDWAAEVRASLAGGAPDDQCVADFSAGQTAALQDSLPADVAATYVHGDTLDMSWYGLARYWRKKTEAEA